MPPWIRRRQCRCTLSSLSVRVSCSSSILNRPLALYFFSITDVLLLKRVSISLYRQNFASYGTYTSSKVVHIICTRGDFRCCWNLPSYCAGALLTIVALLRLYLQKVFISEEHASSRPITRMCWRASCGLRWTLQIRLVT